MKQFQFASKGEGYTTTVFIHDQDDPIRVSFKGDLDVDCDGSGPNPFHDPYFQADTSLHHNGLAINANEVPGIVVPPMLRDMVHGIVLGCKARVTYKGKSIDAVVFDIGPSRKLGEASTEAARRLGINTNPNNGGVDDPEVLYEYWPGVPAVVDGIEYKLQPA